MHNFISAEGITKSFGAIKALDDIGFTLRRGEIHGIVGENGAGKTTFIRVLQGIEKPDRGTVTINGRVYDHMTPSLSRGEGISVIPQKVQLADELTVGENLFLNNWTGERRFGLIDWKTIYRETKTLLEKMNLDIDPRQKAGSLSWVDKQIIQIVRAFFVEKADVILLDEPTAALVESEVKLLFDFILSFREQNKSFIYISHFLHEIFRICDRVTTFRDGRVVDVADVADLSMEKLVGNMVGSDVELFPERISEIGEPVLEVRNLRVKPVLKDVSFSVGKGEILGLAGLKGSGRTETGRALCGLDPYEKGEIRLKGEKIGKGDVRKRLAQGLGYLTEDRLSWSLFLDRPINENISITFLKRLLGFCGFIDTKKERSEAARFEKLLQIKTTGSKQLVRELSGGNQQKVSIAKLLGCELDVLFFDDPGFGIDVKAKMNIHQIMNDFVSKGGAVIMTSSDIMELVGMCDRICILKNGTVTGEIRKGELDEEQLLKILEE